MSESVSTKQQMQFSPDSVIVTDTFGGEPDVTTYHLGADAEVAAFLDSQNFLIRILFAFNQHILEPKISQVIDRVIQKQERFPMGKAAETVFAREIIAELAKTNSEFSL